MTFIDKLQLEHLEGDKWKLLSEFRYQWPRKNRLITVPAGYITDQASVPGFILPIIVNDTGNISEAALPHDYGYSDLDHKEWSKLDVDLMFRDAMIEADVPKWRAYIAWTGVRLNLKAQWEWGK